MYNVKLKSLFLDHSAFQRERPSNKTCKPVVDRRFCMCTCPQEIQGYAYTIRLHNIRTRAPFDVLPGRLFRDWRMSIANQRSLGNAVRLRSSFIGIGFPITYPLNKSSVSVRHGSPVANHITQPKNAKLLFGRKWIHSSCSFLSVVRVCHCASTTLTTWLR